MAVSSIRSQLLTGTLLLFVVTGFFLYGIQPARAGVIAYQDAYDPTLIVRASGFEAGMPVQVFVDLVLYTTVTALPSSYSPAGYPYYAGTQAGDVYTYLPTTVKTVPGPHSVFFYQPSTGLASNLVRLPSVPYGPPKPNSVCNLPWSKFTEKCLTNDISQQFSAHIYYDTSDHLPAMALDASIRPATLTSLAPNSVVNPAFGIFIVGNPLSYQTITWGQSWTSMVFAPLTVNTEGNIVDAATGNAAVGNICPVGPYYIGNYNGRNFIFGATPQETLAAAQSFPSCPSS